MQPERSADKESDNRAGTRRYQSLHPNPFKSTAEQHNERNALMKGFNLNLSKLRSGFDGRTFWAQARAGTIPGGNGKPAAVIVTAQPTLRSGSDVFYGLSEWRSADNGKTWEGPVHHADVLGRRRERNGIEVGICDATPRWHVATGQLLLTGHTVRYQDNKHPIVARPRETAYAAYSPAAKTWSPWDTVAMPDQPEFGNAGAGSAQRVDLQDGSILLPIYHKTISPDPKACFTATVMRCSFDGEQLKHLEHGNALTVAEPRGLCEPSLVHCHGRYYLTMRNDVRGYVAVSNDGMHFDAPCPWRFDDGTDLGSYNTQQHWVRHRDDLFLVYTRRGLDNDHVFRHRAPLMIAQVDPARRVVLRETERELIPNRGARLGNFSVCDITDDEIWVVAAEWMQPDGCEHYGSDNSIWIARMRWPALQ